MKKHLVGTATGRLLHRVVNQMTLTSMSFNKPENAPVMANQVIAHQLIASLCPSGGTFVDVGAHLGNVFSTVQHADKSIKVIAFEADPEKARHLKWKFPTCTVHAKAVGEAPGRMCFYIDRQKTAYNSLVRMNNRDQTAIEVDSITLDDALIREKPDFLKIDIEGAELGALRGGENAITSHTPTLLFESAHKGENSLGYSAKALWMWLRDRDYGVFCPDRLAHRTRALTLDVFLDAHEHPRRTVDFFAVHRERLAEVRARARFALGIAP